MKKIKIEDLDSRKEKINLFCQRIKIKFSLFLIKTFGKRKNLFVKPEIDLNELI
jgi:hypothetical protein